MPGTFFGIEMGSRALRNFQTGLHVTGHNISNAKTEGYSRQRVMMKTLPPLYEPSLNRPERAGHIGQGMEITEIKRVRDAFIDSRINFEKTSLGYWDKRKEFLSQMEAIHNEPSALNLRTDLDAFWSAWQDVANNPAERASRSLLVERAKRITASVRHSFDQLDNLRKQADLQVKQNVKRINEVAHTIRDLNERILKAEAMGDNPNDLLDRRDLLFEELSTLADVTISSKDPNETIVYIGSRHLIQGELVSELDVRSNPENEGLAHVFWKIDGADTTFEGGAMRGLMEIRDIDLVHAINKLDAFALNVTEAVNEIHRDGFGVNLETGHNFFQTLPIATSAVGNYDIEGDGTLRSVLFKMGGVNELNPEDAIGIEGMMTFGNVERGAPQVNVQYTSDQSVEEVITNINNSDANVVAYLDHRGRLTLKSKVFDDYQKPNFMITHVEDSGEFLAGFSGLLAQSGAEGAYDYTRTDEYQKLRGDARNFSVTPYHHAAQWMEVGETIQNDLDYVAAAKGIDTTGDDTIDRGNGVGDGSNALEIASLRTQEIMIDQHATFNDYYADIVGEVGSLMETANVETEKQNVMLAHLEKTRQSLSGVNLDEEMAQMMVYQHGYNAAARVVTTMDRLIDTVINRMGV